MSTEVANTVVQGSVEGSKTKVVVDEVSGWMRIFADGSVDRTWTGPPEVEFLAKPYQPSPETALLEDGIELHDLTIPPPFDLSLRLYYPAAVVTPDEENKAEKKKLPVLLHFQGGGFCISRATWYMYYHFYSRLATTVGAAVVSVSTRLAPEHRLPAAMDDGYNALLWLRSLASSPDTGDVILRSSDRLQERVDFSRVFLIGDSSGGNIVHEVMARAGREETGFWSPLRVAGGIPIHPGFVRSYRSKSELEGKQDPFLTLDMLDKFLNFGLPLGSTKDHPYTCPMGEAAPPLEGLRMPPLMVAVAENDLIRDTEMEYCEAMRKAGKDVEVFPNKGVGHSFYLNKIAVDMDPTVGRATEELIQAIGEFMDKH